MLATSSSSSEMDNNSEGALLLSELPTIRTLCSSEFVGVVRAEFTLALKKNHSLNQEYLRNEQISHILLVLW